MNPCRHTPQSAYGGISGCVEDTERDQRGTIRPPYFCQHDRVESQPRLCLDCRRSGRTRRPRTKKTRPPSFWQSIALDHSRPRRALQMRTLEGDQTAGGPRRTANQNIKQRNQGTSGDARMPRAHSSDLMSDLRSFTACIHSVRKSASILASGVKVTSHSPPLRRACRHL